MIDLKAAEKTTEFCGFLRRIKYFGNRRATHWVAPTDRISTRWVQNSTCVYTVSPVKGEGLQNRLAPLFPREKELGDEGKNWDAPLEIRHLRKISKPCCDNL